MALARLAALLDGSPAAQHTPAQSLHAPCTCVG